MNKEPGEIVNQHVLDHAEEPAADIRYTLSKKDVRQCLSCRASAECSKCGHCDYCDGMKIRKLEAELSDMRIRVRAFNLRFEKNNKEIKRLREGLYAATVDMEHVGLLHTAGYKIVAKALEDGDE